MKLLLVALLVLICPLGIPAQSSAPKKATPAAHPNLPASQDIQTEQVVTPAQTPPVPAAPPPVAGHLEPEQVKALMHKIWLAQYRLNDLLTQVHPDKWKMAPAARQSFDQSMESLRKALGAEDDWRGQFESRPDSLYLGFETYIALGAVLPRVDGLAHSISKYENASFGAQYSQSANQLFDLQQMLQPHLAVLLKNIDSVQVTAQTNLSACENQLNFAMYNRQQRAVPMRNIAPAFKGHGRTAHPAAAAPSIAAKPEPQKTAPAKSAAKTAHKTQKKQ